jgi:uncharacterized membrane protein YkvA (DUF1232 family)
MNLKKKRTNDEVAGTTQSFTEKDAEKALKATSAEAEALLNDENKMNDFMSQLKGKMNSVTGFNQKFADIPVIVSLIRSYMKGEYRELPVGTMIALIGALIYFVSPIDVIPDCIPGVGYLDDAVVIGVAVKFAYSDLEDYKKWLAKNNMSVDD